MKPDETPSCYIIVGSSCPNRNSGLSSRNSAAEFAAAAAVFGNYFVFCRRRFCALFNVREKANTKAVTPTPRAKSECLLRPSANPATETPKDTIVIAVVTSLFNFLRLSTASVSCLSSVKKVEERKQPKPMFRDFLDAGFFQFLVAISAIAGIFGWVLVAHFADGRFSLAFL
jgi:hypothetical protein